VILEDGFAVLPLRLPLTSSPVVFLSRFGLRNLVAAEAQNNFLTGVG
jgi:hypothetical protein